MDYVLIVALRGMDGLKSKGPDSVGVADNLRWRPDGRALNKDLRPKAGRFGKEPAAHCQDNHHVKAMLSSDCHGSDGCIA